MKIKYLIFIISKYESKSFQNLLGNNVLLKIVQIYIL